MEQILRQVEAAREQLKKLFEGLEDKQQVLRSDILKNLYKQISGLPVEDKAKAGQLINDLKNELQAMVELWQNQLTAGSKPPIDITAPYDANLLTTQKPYFFGADNGSTHPITTELYRITDIFKSMGFTIEQSRQIDDEYHMFDSLNFPANHPARDEYDTFLTEEGLVLPAHTSTMQTRILKKYSPPIRAIIPGRTFRNEDVDATHEHTLHQIEGLVVDEGLSLGDLLGVLKAFLEAYFDETVEYKTQPFYFPFVEPGLELLIKAPKSIKGNLAGQWLEILGCGMVHPNVLRNGGIDPEKYSGFAWGMGADRLVMLKFGVEDIRHFMSGNLNFLKQFRAGQL